MIRLLFLACFIVSPLVMASHIEEPRWRLIDTIGVPVLNQYNPPWILPFLRRNEVTVAVAPRDALAAAQ